MTMPPLLASLTDTTAQDMQHLLAPRNTGMLIRHPIHPTSLFGSDPTGAANDVQMPPVMPLPPPPAAAAAQWAQHAYTAATQAAAAKAAAAKAAEVASAQAAAAQAAATQAQVAQVSAQQAAAAQVAQSLGYNVAPVGVPTAAAYGDLPAAAPPYGLSTPNPVPNAVGSAAMMSNMGEGMVLPAVLMSSRMASSSAKTNTCHRRGHMAMIGFL